MPISLPTVPVRLPGQREVTWVDLREELNHNRFLFLCEELEIEIANDLIGLLIYFGWDEKDITFFINSPGGDLFNGITIHNIMLNVPADIITVCLGEACSIASYILIAGTMGKRVALPHARIMIHQPTGVFWSDGRKPSTVELFDEVKELMAARELISRGYCRRTGQPLSVIAQDMERDFYMSAKEAKDYGIIDLIKAKSMKEDPPPMNIW